MYKELFFLQTALLAILVLPGTTNNLDKIKVYFIV